MILDDVANAEIFERLRTSEPTELNVLISGGLHNDEAIESLLELRQENKATEYIIIFL